jgi:serine protease Do
MKTFICGLVILIPMSAATTGNSDVLHPDYLKQISYLDCSQLTKTLSDGLMALRDAGKTTPSATLRQQLSRTCCTAQLRAPAKSLLSSEELYRENKEAVLVTGFLHKCRKCSKMHMKAFASGFLISSDGVMVTNYHVLDQDNDGVFGAMTYRGDVYPVVEVLAANKVADIAIVKLDASKLPCLAMTPENPIGSRVWVISNPAKQFYTFSEGMVSGRTVNHAEGESSKRFSITADYGGGSSGAPVFESCGNVVGMVCSTQVVTTEATPHSYPIQLGYPQMVINRCIPAELITQLFVSDEKQSTTTTTGER